MLKGLRQKLLAAHEARPAVLPATLIYTLGAFGGVCLMSTHIYLFEQSVCRKHYTKTNPSFIGINGLMPEKECKGPDIQAEVATIHGVFSFLSFFPALVFTGPYRNITKVLGKNTVMLLNICSAVASATYFTFICYYHNTFDIRWIYLSPFFDVIGGGSVIMSSFLYSYVSSSVSAEHLSGVFYRLSAIQLASSFLGLTLSSYLLRTHVWLLCAIGLVTLSAMIPVCLLFPPPPQSNTIPDHASPTPSEIPCMTPGTEIDETTALLSTQPQTQPFDPSSLSSASDTAGAPIMKTIVFSLSEHHTHSIALVRSINESSPFSKHTMLTYFVLMIGLGIKVIFSQWGSITFGWRFADINRLGSFEMVVSGLVLLALPSLACRFIRPRFDNCSADTDLFVAKASLLCYAAGVLAIGFAPSKVAYVLAVTTWTLGSGLLGALRSFVTASMSSKKEVEQLYLGIGMVETLGAMCATIVWSGGFSKVVGAAYWVERLPFMGSVVVLLGALILLGILSTFNKGLKKFEI